MKKCFAVLLAVVLVMTLPVTVFATKSATGVSHFTVFFINGNGAVTKTENVTVGSSIEFSADEKKGDFDEWTVYKADGSVAVEGVDYTVEGSLKDKNIKITPLSNIIVTGNYDNVKTDFVVNNGEPESPKTGDVTAIAMSVMALVSLAGAGIAKKQLSK